MSVGDGRMVGTINVAFLRILSDFLLSFDIWNIPICFCKFEDLILIGALLVTNRVHVFLIAILSVLLVL